METHLKIIGALLVMLAAIHVIFPRYFNWEKETRSLSLINRQMMYVHTFFIAFVVALMGLLCLTTSEDLPTTVHIVFSMLWAYFSGVFLWVYWCGA